MALPVSFLNHLRESGYHSRSDKHSKALSEAIVADLMAYCERIAADALTGQLVFWHNHDLSFGHSTWNTDLAVGTPPPGPLRPGARSVAGMVEAIPATTRIAVELKSVMTEHAKARKNRKRDLEAHHAHVHDYDPRTIAAGVVMVNAAPVFKSPLRPALTVHTKPPAELVRLVLDEVNNITTAGGGRPAGLDAKRVIAVSMDNIDPAMTSFFTSQPAPQTGSPLHWDSFIQRLCGLYGRVWG